MYGLEPFQVGKFGVYGFTFAPTLGKYRGDAEIVLGGHARLHATCPHEHGSMAAAIKCARDIAKVAVTQYRDGRGIV